MRICIFALIVCLVSHTVSELPSSSERDWESLLDELDSIDAVTGRAIGAAAQPGRFFILSECMIEIGREEDFLGLLQDRRPVFRCMGLLTLAQVQGEASVSVLRARLTDRQEFEYMSGGCGIWNLNVAQFAAELLRDANHLGHRKSLHALLSKVEMVGVDLQIVAGDPAMRCSLRSFMALRKVMEGGGYVAGMRSCQRNCPALEGYEIVNVLGRLPICWAQRDFLVACLRDEKLDGLTRLAAASALTRYGGEVSIKIVNEYREVLNDFAEGRPGDYLAETLNIKRDYDATMKTIRSRWPWKKIEPVPFEAAIAATGYHPLVLNDLLQGTSPSSRLRGPEGWRMFANSVVKISGCVGNHNQLWNTYADSIDRLAYLVEWNRLMESRGPLTEAECSEIERNIESFIQEPEVAK